MICCIIADIDSSSKPLLADDNIAKASNVSALVTHRSPDTQRAQ